MHGSFAFFCLFLIQVCRLFHLLKIHPHRRVTLGSPSSGKALCVHICILCMYQNFTLVSNNWIATGRRRSKCFPVSSGSFQVTFNGTEMLHGVYGGEDGRPVNVGDSLVHGYFIIFNACAQQPILIQFQSDIPARRLPVEGWSIEALQLYNRQLGRGRGQSVFKIRLSPDDPTMFVVQTQDVLSFP